MVFLAKFQTWPVIDLALFRLLTFMKAQFLVEWCELNYSLSFISWNFNDLCQVFRNWFWKTNKRFIEKKRFFFWKVYPRLGISLIRFDIFWYFLIFVDIIFLYFVIFFKKIRIFVKLFFVNFQNFEKIRFLWKYCCWYFLIRKKEIPSLEVPIHKI